MKRILFLSLLILISLVKISNACTVLIAGKKTTVDGSIMFAKTEDDGLNFQLDYLWKIPRKKFPAVSTKKLISGLLIPEVSETYAYTIDECPQTHFSNMVINEWGLAIGSNGCHSKENIEDLKTNGDIVNGGIGFDLRFILAERAKTAKEAVNIAIELLNKYGYNASGRNLNIVDQHEAWQLQMVAGKRYVARKVQDDEVVVIANTFSIREVNMNDRENFICSPDLIDYATEKGWYDPDSGKEFDFALAYAPKSTHLSKSNVHRQWMMAHLINSDFDIDLDEAEAGMMPVSVKPKRKISVQDLFKVFRSHYEGTRLNDGTHELSPHYLPHTICRYTTHRTTIVQQRSELPAEIGTLCWRSLGEPCNSIFVPWYLGAENIPAMYLPKQIGKRTIEPENFKEYHFGIPAWKIQQIDLKDAARAFWLLGQLADVDYQKNNKLIKKKFRPIETKLLNEQKQLEQKALTLYQQNKQDAIKFLTEHTEKWAIKSYQDARQMIEMIINE